MVIAVFAIKALGSLMNFHELSFSANSLIVAMPLLAFAASALVLVPLALANAIGRWGSVIALPLVYANHCLLRYNQFLAQGASLGGETVGAALFEAILFFAFTTVWFNLVFGSSVRAFFKPHAEAAA